MLTASYVLSTAKVGFLAYAMRQTHCFVRYCRTVVALGLAQLPRAHTHGKRVRRSVQTNRTCPRLDRVEKASGLDGKTDKRAMCVPVGGKPVFMVVYGRALSLCLTVQTDPYSRMGEKENNERGIVLSSRFSRNLRGISADIGKMVLKV